MTCLEESVKWGLQPLQNTCKQLTLGSIDIEFLIKEKNDAIVLKRV